MRYQHDGLMFLAQEPPREYPPYISLPYPSLGNTDIRDADLGVHLPNQIPHVELCWGGGRKDNQRTGPINIHGVYSYM